MTQHSRPQEGLRPADGPDCGAYTANQWRQTLIGHNRSGGMIVTGAAAPPGLPATQQFPNVGVYYATPNRLSVSSPAAAQISIDTGMAIVDGTLFDNDEAVTAEPVTIPAGGANSRVDIVVVRQNYTNAVYTPTYVPGLTVPANTARITVISGAEAVGPVAPTLTQDEDRLTYWDIPLYQYEIVHTSGVISAEVNLREWVDAEMKYHWAPYVGGYDFTGGAQLDPGWLGIEMPAAILASCFTSWQIPIDYIGQMECLAVLVPDPGAAGDVVLTHEAMYGVCGDPDYDDNLDRACHESVITVAGADIECLCALDLQASVRGRICAAGDIVFFKSYRKGTDVLDTAGTINFTGERIRYLGWGRR